MYDVLQFDQVIIDGDPIVYRAGFAIEKVNKEMDIIETEPMHHAFYNVNSMIKKTLNKFEHDFFEVFLTASNDTTNFRFSIFPQYKANRKDARRPVYYKEIREHLFDKWGAETIKGQEADDTCSIWHCKALQEGKNSVMCSIDKDFNNVPGWHYNYVTDDLYYIDEIQALRNFYLQILTGDTSDGIPRIKKGWRQKKVEEELQKALTEQEMYDIIHKEISNLTENLDKLLWIIQNVPENRGDIKDEILRRGRLVWLRREEGELWVPKITKEVENV